MKTSLACILALAAGPAAAQGTGWSFAVSPYAWLPGLTTSADLPPGRVEVETSGGDTLSNLDFAFMGAFEARNGRWGLIADLLYTDLSDSKPAPLGLLYSRARVETQMLAVTGYAYFRAYETDQVALDVLGGVRYFDTSVTLRLTPGELDGARFDMDGSWFDPLVGARARVDFIDAWFATALIDYAGFGGGSDTSWQALATIGYQFNDRWSVQGGWRHLKIEKEMGGIDVGVVLSGPILGFTMRF